MKLLKKGIDFFRIRVYRDGSKIEHGRNTMKLKLFYDERLSSGITADFDENDRNQDVYTGMSDECFENAKEIVRIIKDIHFNPNHVPDYFDGDYDVFSRHYNNHHYFFRVFDDAENLAGYEAVCIYGDAFSDREEDEGYKCFIDADSVKGYSDHKIACFLLNTIQQKIHDANVNGLETASKEPLRRKKRH